MRAFLAKHAIVIGGICVTATLFLVLLITLYFREPAVILPPANTNAYFYDLTDGKVVELPDNLIPPIKQAGHEYVKAMVFACKNCADPADRFTGALKSFTPQRRQAEEIARRGMLPGDELPTSEVTRLNNIGGVLIRAVDGAQFFPAQDPEAQPIIDAYMAKCAQSIVECKPL